MMSFPTAAKLTVIAVAIVGATGGAARHAAAAASVAVVPQSAGDPVAGRTLYQVCTGCHSLDENDVGPRHRGVVGRKAGTVPGYAYSAALRTSGMVWTPANLDRSCAAQRCIFRLPTRSSAPTLSPILRSSADRAPSSVCEPNRHGEQWPRPLEFAPACRA
jgi:cytochrome c